MAVIFYSFHTLYFSFPAQDLVESTTKDIIVLYIFFDSILQI